MILLYIAAGLIVGVLITRPFTTFFHELGHALAFWAFTKQGSNIYIGSYGNQQKSVRFQLGKMSIWFHKNPLYWQYGLCEPQGRNISPNGQFISALCGVLFSLIAAACFTWLAFTYDWHGFLKLLFIFATGSAIFDIFVNLRAAEIPLADGRTLYTDGYILRQTRLFKKNMRYYTKGVKLYEEKKFSEAASVFDALWNGGFENEATASMIAYSHMGTKNFDKAQAMLINAEQRFGRSLQTRLDFAWLHMEKNNTEQAKEYLQQALELDPSHVITLNNFGYQLLKESRFSKAIPYFDKAIAGKPDFAFAFNNRGYAKIESGDMEGGLKDIEEGLRLDNQNSYGYRNKGIYFLKKNQKKKALELLLLARQIDPDTEMIDDYISKAQ